MPRHSETGHSTHRKRPLFHVTILIRQHWTCRCPTHSNRIRARKPTPPRGDNYTTLGKVLLARHPAGCAPPCPTCYFAPMGALFLQIMSHRSYLGRQTSALARREPRSLFFFRRFGAMTEFARARPTSISDSRNGDKAEPNASDDTETQPRQNRRETTAMWPHPQHPTASTSGTPKTPAHRTTPQQAKRTGFRTSANALSENRACKTGHAPAKTTLQNVSLFWMQNCRQPPPPHSENVARMLSEMLFFASLLRKYLHLVSRSNSLTINKVHGYERLTNLPIAGCQPV